MDVCDCVLLIVGKFIYLYERVERDSFSLFSFLILRAFGGAFVEGFIVV